MGYTYALISLIVFIVFTVANIVVSRKLRGGFIDRKSRLFLLAYIMVFFLKAFAYIFKLLPDVKNLPLYKFIQILILSIAADIVTFLLYTFVFEIKEVNIKLAATSHDHFLA